MEARSFIGKLLSDGQLSLPGDTAKQVGKVFEGIQIIRAEDLLIKEGFI